MDPIPYQTPESLRPGNSAVIPSELLASPPRRVVVKPERSRGLQLAVFWTIVIAAAAWLVCLVAEPILIWSSPTVSAKWIDRSSDGRVNFLTFQYTIGGRPYTVTEQVDRDTYRAAAGGSALVVRVVPLLGARLDDLWEPYVESRIAVWWLTGPAELILAIYLLFGDETPWAIKRERRLQTRLVEQGAPAVARVTSVVQSFRVTQSSRSGIVYWFNDADGIRRERAIAMIPGVRQNDELIVLYEPARPTVNRVYDQMAVSADQTDQGGV